VQRKCVDEGHASLGARIRIDLVELDLSAQPADLARAGASPSVSW